MADCSVVLDAVLRCLLLELALSVGSVFPSPELSECYTVNGKDYRGSVSHAGPERTPCLYWNQTTQHTYNIQSDPSGELGLGTHNHCRNPDSDVQPWCYVSETEDGIYWKYCDIPACNMPGYIGCFVDSGSPPALSGASATSAKLTVQTCIRFCRRKGYQYAGVEAGYACFCGDLSDVSRLQQRGSSSQCDQACFGRPNELCGGDGRISVYSVWVGACRGNLSTPHGVLYSPDFPDDYRPGSTCFWEVHTPGSNAIELQFRSFQVLDPSDVLELRDGTNGGLLVQIRGGEKPPNSIILPTGHLQVSFQADRAHSGPGYAIAYRGLELLSSPGVSTSPDSENSLNAQNVSLQTPVNTAEKHSTEHTASGKGWILLTASVSLLVLCAGYMIRRYSAWGCIPLSPAAGVRPSSCSMLYRHMKGRSGDLTCVNQTSVRSLL
ncbi:kremen protein 2 [Spea bombifrons]|uniref:kremen protein 2 n=1 Tax=Spea bombifrons TaxID=233779 RepID=UPI00234BE3C4|nr:kremen protein 2 [Spea bombifrons]